MTIDIDCINKLILKYNLSIQAAVAILNNEITLKEAISNQKFSERVNNLVKAPDIEWPRLEVHWDLDQKNWYRSMDDHSPESFQKRFGEVSLIWVQMSKLITSLYSWRIQSPFHQNYRKKSAALLVYLSDGGKVSPPMALNNDKGIIIVGGNHRLGWAQEIKQQEIPMLVQKDQREIIEQQMKVLR